MIKYISILLLCLFCGCNASNTDVTSSFQLPEEIKDYKIIKMANKEGYQLYVLLKKTNETRNVIGTASLTSNTQIHTIIIDGVEYVRKVNE